MRFLLSRRQSYTLLLIEFLSLTLFAASAGAALKELTKIFLHGSLKEAVGQSEMLIPFTPYRNGDGPLIKSAEGVTVLVTAEIVEFEDGVASVSYYPVAVSFSLGDGMVYYSSFTIPENLDTVIPGLTEADMPAIRELARWFMSKPIANADRLKLLKTYRIAKADVGSCEDTTVDRAKSRGLPADLTANAGVIVMAAISETVLGKVDYSTIPADSARKRLWTASLIKPDGQVFATQTTSGGVIVFPVKAQDNTGGTWRVKINSATGYLNEQLFFTTVVKGLNFRGKL
jgi:hypothetical protein